MLKHDTWWEIVYPSFLNKLTKLTCIETILLTHIIGFLDHEFETHGRDANRINMTRIMTWPQVTFTSVYSPQLAYLDEEVLIDLIEESNSADFNDRDKYSTGKMDIKMDTNDSVTWLERIVNSGHVTDMMLNKMVMLPKMYRDVIKAYVDHGLVNFALNIAPQAFLNIADNSRGPKKQIILRLDFDALFVRECITVNKRTDLGVDLTEFGTMYFNQNKVAVTFISPTASEIPISKEIESKLEAQTLKEEVHRLEIFQAALSELEPITLNPLLFDYEAAYRNCFDHRIPIMRRYTQENKRIGNNNPEAESKDISAEKAKRAKKGK
jgi:hypothetical protein